MWSIKYSNPTNIHSTSIRGRYKWIYSSREVQVIVHSFIKCKKQVEIYKKMQVKIYILAYLPEHVSEIQQWKSLKNLSNLSNVVHAPKISSLVTATGVSLLAWGSTGRLVEGGYVLSPPSTSVWSFPAWGACVVLLGTSGWISIVFLWAGRSLLVLLGGMLFSQGQVDEKSSSRVLLHSLFEEDEDPLPFQIELLGSQDSSLGIPPKCKTG